MNKSQFVELVKENGGYKSIKDAENAIKTVTESIQEAVTKGESVSIVGFGAWTPHLQAGKSGKVPGTDKTYSTQDKMVPKFKAGKNFKESVANGKV